MHVDYANVPAEIPMNRVNVPPPVALGMWLDVLLVCRYCSLFLQVRAVALALML